MPETQRLDHGLIETGEAGVDAYSSGGVTVQTDLGRIDHLQVTADNETYQVSEDETAGGDSEFSVQLFTAEVDTTTSNASESVSWTELADAADISADTIKYTAIRE